MYNSHFKVPGVTITDISRHYGVNGKKLAESLGIELVMLSPKRYAPLSNAQIYQLIRLIRSRQGARFLRALEKSSM